MRKNIEKVSDGQALASKAIITFDQIFETIKTNLVEIHEVSKSAQEMAKSNQKVNDAISIIATISEHSIANIEEVSATAEEQNSLVLQVSYLAENLTKIAAELEQTVAIFKIE